MFQDNIMSVTDSIAAARSVNLWASVMRSKQLCLNSDKTGFIIFGKKKEVEEPRREIEKNPVMCGNLITKEKISDKKGWLLVWIFLNDVTEVREEVTEEEPCTIVDIDDPDDMEY